MKTSWVMMTSPSMPITSVTWVMRRDPSRRRAAWTMTSTEAQIISRIVRDGIRRVTHITEVMGMEGDVIITQDLVTYEFKGESQDGRLSGVFKSSGLRPHFMPRAAYYGLDKVLMEAMG